MTENNIKNENENSLRFPWKIAIITVVDSIMSEDYHSANWLVSKYGKDKVIHLTWAENFLAGQDEMINIVSALKNDMEIKILIINQAIPGTNAFVDKLKETRDDIFIVYCTVHDRPSEAAARANMLLMNDFLGMGPAIVNQARKQGAKAFVHYSFPRHVSRLNVSSRRDLIKQTCEAEDILFVDAKAPDPMELGIGAARQFILEDVPKMVSRYGEDTAFFCTNCTLQAPLIKAVVDCHAIYPQPCCPSPYHGFPEALGIKTSGSQADLNFVISEASRIAAEKNMTDRLSTWPVSASIMFTNTAVEYGIKRINGEVPRERIDDRVLEDCMNSFIKEVVGEGIEVTLTSYSENGVDYENFKLTLMGYLDF